MQYKYTLRSIFGELGKEGVLFAPKNLIKTKSLQKIREVISMIWL